MAARLDAPVLGAFGSSYAGGERWQFTMSHRYQKSDRHFVGPVYQAERDHEGSQVINRVHQSEIAFRYKVDDLWSVTVAAPYLVASRSSALRNAARDIIGRTKVQSEGLGDVTVVARRWILPPPRHPNTNLSLGIGVKLPTGKDGVRDVRLRVVNDQVVPSDEINDQSIQPGDGGLGAILDMQFFHRMAQDRLMFYLGTTYLFNPKGNNGTATGRSRASEAIMSVADQYVARLGFTATGPKWRGFSAGLGGRLEGVPVHDVFGPSDQFRRPGYAISIEPSIAWTRGSHSVTVAIPYAMYRNRTRSYADRLDGRHGDAAFADWVGLGSYSYRFGKPTKVSACSQKAAAAAAAEAATPEE